MDLTIQSLRKLFNKMGRYKRQIDFFYRLNALITCLPGAL